MADEGITPAVEAAARRACECRTCFGGSIQIVEPPCSADGVPYDIAQPRWIGPGYFDARPRVVVLMTNPGAGEKAERQAANANHLRILRSFRSGGSTLRDVFSFQIGDMNHWGGRRSFLEFYGSDRGLVIDRIAFLNIAWCPTKANRYPAAMLSACWSGHTRGFLRLLDPQVIVLAGSKAWAFSKSVADAVPGAKIVRSLHHANRESDERNERDAESVRRFVESITS